ncbi:eukaryotic translation initiation factor 3 subunit A family protein [Ancylostoma ceylanicum]|uniref:Eukaryotic translation initiation factor 3 subunit A n=1 Tax=Ancylostoma ceylanicum TaxID=53326 RepID=A0A0D6L9S1_9BILA|nr:eukaryotic translation initiation factor 3 subunit A family protein [Ancylostoma ceylanicum]
MPPNSFQKPETALKRAQELIQVGKESDALDTLHDTIKARRYKQWTQTHEQIMMKHVELCVLLKKPHVAKDALFQYKTLTHQVAVKSLETVIEHFLQMAEQKTEEAQKTSIEKVEEIDDLDQGDVPETLLLSVVSGAAAQDRMDRTVLAPWLRFLWDSYRNCLELLRNNAQHLYHRITRKSFQFCSKYQRRTEFRKLCELLRLHLNQIQKHQYLAHVVKLSSPESLSMMQETRLCQLDTAIQMELWQEAYRSAEDVHGMMQLSKDKDKRMVKPASYVSYYDKLALVFWKAGNSLFHAAALLQKFIIYKDMKKSFTADEAQEQASRVLLATLSIPDGADAPSDLTRHLDIEDQHLTNIRLLSNLLRLPIAPTRAGLLREAARLGVPDVASESTNALYKLLENNFAPLRLAQEVEAQLVKIDRPDHLQYVDALKEVVATKALKQISVIYDSISWNRVQKIIPFYNEMELERLVVDVSKHRFVKAQIDHRSGCIRFGAADVTLAGGVDLEEADGFTGDDTQLGVEGIRTHLELMYNKLRSTVELLDGDKRTEALIARVKHHAINYERTKNSKQETDRILERRRKIEYYKETSERVKAERSQQAAAELAKREEAKRAEEMKRLEQENIESERKRRLAEQEEVQRKIKQDQLRRMQNTAIYQAIVREKGEQVFKDMDPEAVLREQRQRLDKERMETQRRLQQQDKTFDHYIRALHLEEMLERKAIMTKRMSEAPKLHEEYERRRIQKAVDDHNSAVTMWQRLEEVREDSMDWITQVKEMNADDFAKKTAEWTNKLNAVRSARLQERAEQRKKERREKWARAKVEEERRRREEEERQRQQLIEEQRRAAREPRGPTRREMDMDSKAMADSDWRGGMRERQAIPTRPPPGRDRDLGDRPPMRERENIISQADRDDSWRRGMNAAPTPAASLRERAPPAPLSNADKDTSWRAHMQAPAAQPPPSTANAPPGKPAEGAKFIPSRLRNQAAQQGGLPTRDMGPRGDTRRIGTRGPGAESDTNWRRK